MRSALLWLAVLAAGIALFFYGGTMDMRSPLAMPLVYAGGAMALAALVMLIVTWRRSRRRAYAAAIQAPDAIARWQIYPSDMAAFRKVDAARAGRLWSLGNYFKFRGPVPAEGLPVVIGEKSLLIGEKYYDFGLQWFGDAGEITLHEGQPGFLEISCYLETTKAPLINVLRIPVPAAAREEAAKAYAHLLGQVKPHDRERLRSTFADHFEAAEQTTDAPHRLQRRRKIVLPLIALFCLAMLAFILYRLMRPREYVPPSYPVTWNESGGSSTNANDASIPPG